MFQIKFLEKSEHVLRLITFIWKYYALEFNVGIYGTTGQARDDNYIMAHSIWMLDN